MKNEIKVIKLKEEEIVSILGEYFNFSDKRYVKKGVKSVQLNLYGNANENLRLVCVLSSSNLCQEINLDEVDKNLDFTGDKSIDLKI